jgi:glycosyltransferase involved in cell wall biosynthesis
LFQVRAQSLLEYLCVRRANAVILNTENARNEFESYYEGTEHGDFTVIPNGYDPALASFVQNPDTSDSCLLADGAIRLCHCGSVYGNRSLLPLVKAIGKLKATGRRFELKQVGAVAADSELNAFLNEHKLESAVCLAGQLPHDLALASMAAAHILVVIQGGTDLQVPAKLFEMLPFGKPILALTGSGPTAEIVRKYRLGLVVDPNDPTAIATAIADLAVGSYGADVLYGAQQALHDFDGCRLTGKLADILRNCVRPRRQEYN